MRLADLAGRMNEAASIPRLAWPGALLAVVTMLVPAKAAPITGRDLAEMCVKYEPRASYYILGAIDAFGVRIGQPKRFCIPAGADIPSIHLTNTVCRYVSDHSQQQGLGAGVLIFRALRDAYPCGPRR